MKVKLMLTCLCDAFFGEVGIATVRVLEHAGCEVEFIAAQTCCGQPPFNSGDWQAARPIAEHCIATLRMAEDRAIVTPSGSCAAMIREGYSLLFSDERHYQAFELSEFLVRRLAVASWPGSVSPRKVAVHRACHGRGLGLSNEVEELVGSINGVELVEFDQQEQCCGFGGAFSAGQPFLSAGIGMEKLHNIVASGATHLVSGDMGCLMHLNGLIERNTLPLKVAHFSQLLAEALPS